MDPDFIRDLFAPFGPVTVRRMFSGAGIFADGLMFGLIVRDVIYLKADETSIADFKREGCAPFTYTRGKKSGRPKEHSLPYWRLTERLYDDPEELAVWARRAFAIAQRKKFSHRGRVKRKAASKRKSDGLSQRVRPLAGPMTGFAKPIMARNWTTDEFRFTQPMLRAILGNLEPLRQGMTLLALGKMMASDPKTAKTDAAPKKDAAAKVESTAAADAPKDTPKATGGDTAAAAPSNYSRGEGQKLVTAAYKENWNAIFARKKNTKKGTKTKKR